MVGTFGGALEARKIDASDGRLTADVRGEVESEDGVLVIRRIHVDMKLRALEEARSTVERVHGLFASKCRAFRSLTPAIQITSSYTLVTSPCPGNPTRSRCRLANSLFMWRVFRATLYDSHNWISLTRRRQTLIPRVPIAYSTFSPLLNQALMLLTSIFVALRMQRQRPTGGLH